MKTTMDIQLTEVAKNLDMTLEQLKETIYREVEVRYRREDVKTWCEENVEGEVGEGQIGVIMERLEDKWDCNEGTWTNIENAYNNSVGGY